MLRWAALSFVLIFAATLTFRIVTGRSGGSARADLVVDETGAAIVTDARPNEPSTQIGSLLVRNAGVAELTFVRATLRSVDPGLGVAGFAVLYPHENDSMLGGQCGPFPPPNFATHPVEGAVLGAGARAAIVVAVRATREGDFAIDGVRVTYASGAKRYHQDLPLRVTVRARASNPACRFDPAPHQLGGGPGA